MSRKELTELKFLTLYCVENHKLERERYVLIYAVCCNIFWLEQDYYTGTLTSHNV